MIVTESHILMQEFSRLQLGLQFYIFALYCIIRHINFNRKIWIKILKYVDTLCRDKVNRDCELKRIYIRNKQVRNRYKNWLWGIGGVRNLLYQITIQMIRRIIVDLPFTEINIFTGWLSYPVIIPCKIMNPSIIIDYYQYLFKLTLLSVEISMPNYN